MNKSNFDCFGCFGKSKKCFTCTQVNKCINERYVRDSRKKTGATNSTGKE